MSRVAAFATVAAIVLTGCGQPSMPRRVSRDLQARVATIRDALEGGQRSEARHELARLARRVDRLLERGLLAEGTAVEILGAARDVGPLLRLAPAPSPTVEETPPPPDVDGGGNVDGKAKGKDKGGGNGTGGDEGHGNDD